MLLALVLYLVLDHLEVDFVVAVVVVVVFVLHVAQQLVELKLWQELSKAFLCTDS